MYSRTPNSRPRRLNVILLFTWLLSLSLFLIQLVQLVRIPCIPLWLSGADNKTPSLLWVTSGCSPGSTAHRVVRPPPAQNTPASSACRGGSGISSLPGVPGHFGGCCGNCKWRDRTAHCSVSYGEGEDMGVAAAQLARRSKHSLVFSPKSSVLANCRSILGAGTGRSCRIHPSALSQCNIRHSGNYNWP